MRFFLRDLCGASARVDPAYGYESAARRRQEGTYGWGAKEMRAGVLRLQLILVAVSITVFLLLKLLAFRSSLLQTLTFTLLIGNWTSFFTYSARRICQRKRFPWNWVLFLLVLMVVGITGTAVAEVVATLTILWRTIRRFLQAPRIRSSLRGTGDADIGFVNFAFDAQAEKLEARNLELQGQVQLGQVKEQSHEAELGAGARDSATPAIPARLRRSRAFRSRARGNRRSR